MKFQNKRDRSSDKQANKSLARYKGVEDKIKWEGFRDVQSLSKELIPGSFVLCDCEGAELELLDPMKVPELKQAQILVELHDFFAPGATAAIIERFKERSKITLINEQGRNPDDYRILFGFNGDAALWSISETRFVERCVTSMFFAYLRPLG